MSNGTRKSDFSQLTTIPAGSTFDFVTNGTNYKIPVEDMIAAFGAIGELAPLGEVTGTPILTQIGTLNYIRNFIDGYGIKSTITAEGGLSVDHNFQQGGEGVQILLDPSTAAPKIASLTAGPGINVSESENEIQLSLADTPVSTKTVVVNAMSDFPAAVAGVITLASDTLYFVTNDLTTASRFVMEDKSVLQASDGNLISLTYTGTGTMISATDSQCKIRDINLMCATGTCLDWASSIGSNKVFQMLNTTITCDTAGTITGAALVNFENIAWYIATNGIILGSVNGFVNLSDQIVQLGAGSFLDLGTSTSSGVSFRNSYVIQAAGTYALSGAVDSGNIVAGGTGAVFNVRSLGSGDFLSGISHYDALWDFQLNDGVPNSITSVLSTHGISTLTISAANTPVIIGATWTSTHESRFSATADGTFTYTGKGAHVNINATITADIATGVDECTFYVYKNGVQEAGSAVTREFDAGNAGNLGLVWQVDLETDDYIELWAENNDTSVNIAIVSAILAVS